MAIRPNMCGTIAIVPYDAVSYNIKNENSRMTVPVCVQIFMERNSM